MSHDHQLSTLGGTVSSGQDILAFLRSKSSAELVAGLGEGFQPVIDGVCFTELPLRGYKAGDFALIDVIVGFNSDEGAGFLRVFARQNPSMNNDKAAEFLRNLVFKKLVPRFVT